MISRFFLASTLALSLVCAVSAQKAGHKTPKRGQKKSEHQLNIPKLPAAAEKIITIVPSGSNDWHASDQSPKKLLANCDAWLSHLKKSSGKTRFVWDKGDSDTYGVWQGEIAILDSHSFKATFGNLYYNEKSEITQHQGEVVANGTRWQIYNQNGFLPSHPINSPRLPKALLATWPEHAQDLIFTALGAGEHPLSTLYRDAKVAGARAIAESRSYAYGGTKLTQFRVLLTGNPVMAGKRTHFMEEILIDQKTGALLKLTQYRQVGNNVKSRFRSYWAVMWDRSEGAGNFDPVIFAMAPPTPPEARSMSSSGSGRRGSR